MFFHFFHSIECIVKNADKHTSEKENTKIVMKNGKYPFTSHCQCASIVHGYCLHSSFSLCLCRLSTFQFNNLDHSLDICALPHMKRRIPSGRFIPSFILSIQPKRLLFLTEFASFHHTIYRFVAFFAWLVRNGVASYFSMSRNYYEQGSLFHIHFLTQRINEHSYLIKLRAKTGHIPSQDRSNRLNRQRHFSPNDTHRAKHHIAKKSPIFDTFITLWASLTVRAKYSLPIMLRNVLCFGCGQKYGLF